MPDAIITSTASTFGTISGTFAADQSTITGTVSGIITGTLTGSVGVPGPAGSPGAPGPGVPVGGTAGQYLQKTTTGVDYATDWVTLNLSAYLTDAPSDGNQYARQSGAWSVVSAGSSYITSVSSPMSVSSGDLTIDLTAYATESWVTSGFYSSTNPSGFITSSALIPYAPLTGGTFSGPVITVAATTAFAGLRIPHGTAPTTGIANGDIWTTTAGIFARINGATQQYAPLASPTFTGNPTAPTAALADNDTSIATTAFVQQELLSGTANARNLEVYVRNQTGSTIPAGSIVYINGATGNRPTVTLAQANNDANSAQTIGFTKTAIANNGFGFVIVRGELEGLNTNSLTEGVQLYLSPTTAGTWTTTKPSAPQHLVYVGIVIRAHPTVGVILVSVQNGYELNELHDVALASEANLDLLTYESSTDLWKNKSFATLGLAPLASPAFTGTPSLPTGTTGITQTAGDNTTALATTAFVTAAVPAFATSTQSRAATSTTVAQSPGSEMWQMMNPGFIRVHRAGHTYTATGTMGTFTAGWYSSLMNVGAGIASAKFRSFGTSQVDQTNICVSRGYRSYIDFSRYIWCSGRFYTENGAWSDPNVSARFYFGKAENSANGDPARKCFGWSLPGNATAANRNPVLQVHNGTTLTSVATTFAVVGQQYFDWDIVSLGNGTVTLYINGTQYATTSAGPTGDTSYSGSAPVIWQEELVATAVPTVGSVVFSRGQIYIAP